MNLATAARRRYALLSPLGGRLRFPQPPHLRLPPLRCSGAMRHRLSPLSRAATVSLRPVSVASARRHYDCRPPPLWFTTTARRPPSFSAAAAPSPTAAEIFGRDVPLLAASTRRSSLPRPLVPSSLFPSYSSLPLSFIVASTRRSSLPRPLIPLPLVF